MLTSVFKIMVSDWSVKIVSHYTSEFTASLSIYNRLPIGLTEENSYAFEVRRAKPSTVCEMNTV
jgi:hypothetical protein